MKIKLTALVTTLLCASTITQADEKYRHFPSLTAENTTVALCNLSTFNQKLQAIVNKKQLTPEDMVKVHELTYTLENAVIRLQKDLDTIAVDLEKVHKASEVLAEKTIKKSGEDYLSATNNILAKTTCS